MLRIYSGTRKIQRLRPGSNPRTLVPEASMLTTRPPKPLDRDLRARIILNELLTLVHNNGYKFPYI